MKNSRAEIVLVRALKWSFTLPLNHTSKKPIGMKPKKFALRANGLKRFAF